MSKFKKYFTEGLEDWDKKNEGSYPYAIGMARTFINKIINHIVYNDISGDKAVINDIISQSKNVLDVLNSANIKDTLKKLGLESVENDIINDNRQLQEMSKAKKRLVSTKDNSVKKPTQKNSQVKPRLGSGFSTTFLKRKAGAQDDSVSEKRKQDRRATKKDLSKYYR